MKAFDKRYNQIVEIVEIINDKVVKIKNPCGDIELESPEVLLNPDTFEPIFR
jgi:hypothetical protein